MNTRAISFILCLAALLPAAFAQDGWTRILTQYETRNVLQTARGTILVGTTSKGVYRSTDDGATFGKVLDLPVPEYFISFEETADGTIYLLGSADVLRSDDDGATWTRCRVFGGLNGGCTLFATDGRTVYVNARRGFYRSGNGGTWERVFDRCFTSLVARADGMLLAQDSGTMDILRSTDGGSSWNAVGRIEKRWGRMLAGRNGIVYYTGNPSYRSRDAGEHWEAMGGIPPDVGAEALAVHPGGGVYRWLQMNIYLSLDDGERWTKVQMRYAYWPQGAFYVDRQWRVYACETGALYRSEPLTSGGDAVANPERFVYDVWPNPARGAAALALSLPRASSVRVSVTDALGRIVLDPETRELQAGTHMLPLRTGGLLPGVYYVRVEGEGMQSVKRLLLLQ